MKKQRRIIIAAAREYPKWNMYLGYHQHLVPILGTPLLRRTAVQALRRSRDVHITIPSGPVGDVYVEALGDTAGRLQIHQNSEEGLCEFTSTRKWWSKDGMTNLLLGDVCYSTNAMEIILNNEDEDFRFFGRYKGSKITGYHAGEGWASAWGCQHNQKIDDAITHVHNVRATGRVMRPPGWMLLRVLQGTDIAKHQVRSPWFVEINDQTEDFDTPEKWNMHPLNRRKDR
jgi:hypothetical protein